MKLARPGQIKSAILSAALLYGETGEDWYLERIRELTILYRNRPDLKYKISSHAIDRFIEKTGCKERKDAEGTLKSFINEAEELELKDRYRAMQLINHNFKDARYFKRSDWLLVVCGDTVVTCHQAEAKRWKKLTEPTKSRIPIETESESL